MGTSLLAITAPMQFQLTPFASFYIYPSRLPTKNNVRCHCWTIQASLLERNINRRDLVLGSGVTTGLGLMWSLSPFLEPAASADLIEQRQRSEVLSKIKDTLRISIQAHRDLIPSIMKLALNDAVTYDKATKTGGANGSIRFTPEMNRPENEGLLPALKLLEDVKKEIDASSKGGPISYADLIQFAGQSAVKRTFLDAAIRKCGGNEEKGYTLYNAYGSNGQWGLFDKRFGRSDAEAEDPEGRVPRWEQVSTSEMKQKFSALGLTPRQLAVMSAFLGPVQEATETKLASDPELAPWVEKYQRSRETVSQTDYEVDLISAFTKLSSIGQNINYEAYTYPRSKIDIRKLKL